jgi:hypothetical protein
MKRVTRNEMYFPHNIDITSIDLPLDYKQKCIDTIYKLGDRMAKKSNVKGIMSSYFIWQQSDVFNDLLGEISKAIKYLYVKDRFNCKVSIMNAWSGIYKKEHYTVPHNHAGAEFSFVYYLQSDGTTPIRFLKNRDKVVYQFYPKDNDLILFPGNIPHDVPEHTSEQDRICIAGNVDYSTPINEEEYQDYGINYKKDEFFNENKPFTID